MCFQWFLFIKVGIVLMMVLCWYGDYAMIAWTEWTVHYDRCFIYNSWLVSGSPNAVLAMNHQCVVWVNYWHASKFIDYVTIIRFVWYYVCMILTMTYRCSSASQNSSYYETISCPTSDHLLDQLVIHMDRYDILHLDHHDTAIVSAWHHIQLAYIWYNITSFIWSTITSYI